MPDDLSELIEEESEVEKRAKKIRQALFDIPTEMAAQICVAAGIVKAGDEDLKALAKLKLLRDLASDKPDPRNIKLASELGIEASAKNFAAGLTITIAPHTVRDPSLPSIIAECDEVVLHEMLEAVLKRIKRTTKTDTRMVAALRPLWEGLRAIFERVDGKRARSSVS